MEEYLGGCTQVRLRRVKGNAHGVSWYANILNVAADTRLPMTLLVEEGKHASCPDRNADGAYTPGYDVNVHVNDAWGVRDVFGSGRLLGSGFSSADALITPSASRWADWYVAAGYEKLEERIDATTGLPDPDYPASSGPALELGYKFRMTFKGKARIASLGYHFGGVRLGVRASGYPMLQNIRAVIEIGAGVF